MFNYLRNNFKDRIDDLEEKIIMALKFASITNVDDDVNLKGVIEKRGNKTVFSDIKTKVETIKQELITNGAKKEGLEIKLKTYQNLFDIFLSFSEETGKKHEIMSSSIRFDFGYLNNPPKNNSQVLGSEFKIEHIDLVEEDSIWIHHFKDEVPSDYFFYTSPKWMDISIGGCYSNLDKLKIYNPGSERLWLHILQENNFKREWFRYYGNSIHDKDHINNSLRLFDIECVR